MARTDKLEVAAAERRFREAFERLKAGEPLRLDKDTEVTQNNVAKEAGTDPSALRRSRYPALVADIQAYRSSRRGPRPKQIAATKRQDRRDEVTQALKKAELGLSRSLSILADNASLRAENKLLRQLLDEAESRAQKINTRLHPT